MKLNRRTLRKMILKEMRSLKEAYGHHDLRNIYGHSWRNPSDWRGVTHGTIISTMRMSEMDPMTFFETIKKVGHDWQLPKVAEALSEIDPSFYDYANQELGIQRYHNNPGKIKLPMLAPNQMGGLEDDDDYDPNY